MDGRVSERRGADAGTRVMRVTQWANPPGDAKNEMALSRKWEGFFCGFFRLGWS